MGTNSGTRCRRCGADLSQHSARYVHVLPIKGEHGVGVVELAMCIPCGTGFATLRERDEYVRWVYLG